MRGFLLCGLLGVITDDAARRAFVAWWRDAIDMSKLTELQACQEADLDQAAWAHMCAGRKHLSGEALAHMPDDVKRWHALITLIELGMPREVRRAARIQLAVSGVKRMLKVKWAPPEGKERTA